MKRIRINTSLIGLIFLTILTLSCKSDNQPKDFDYGKVENSIYLNSFFGFELELPSDWFVQTKELTDNLSEMGKDIVAGEDKNMKALLNASEINTANLLAIFKYEIGAAVDYNPNLILVAENLKNAPGIKTGGDYLFQTRKFLIQSQLEYEIIDDEFNKEVINNQEFYTMNTSMNYMGQNIKQVYYSTINKGFCLSAIISFIDEEQKMGLKKVISSMKFNK